MPNLYWILVNESVRSKPKNGRLSRVNKTNKLLTKKLRKARVRLTRLIEWSKKANNASKQTEVEAAMICPINKAWPAQAHSAPMTSLTRKGGISAAPAFSLSWAKSFWRSTGRRWSTRLERKSTARIMPSRWRWIEIRMSNLRRLLRWHVQNAAPLLRPKRNLRSMVSESTMEYSLNKWKTS